MLPLSKVASLAGAALFVALASEPSFAQDPPETPARGSATPAVSAAPAARPAARVAPEDPATSPTGTPRRAFEGFLRAARANDYVQASTFLDLRGVPLVRRSREGALLAEQLHRVLTWSAIVDVESLPDSAEVAGTSVVVIETLELEGEPVPIVLERQREPSGAWSWRFGPSTVKRIPALYEAEERVGIEARLPAALRDRTVAGLAPWQWIGLALAAIASWLFARLLGVGLVPLLCRIGALVRPTWIAPAIARATGALRLGLALGLFAVAKPWLALPASTALVVSRGQTILLAVAGGWFLVAFVRAAVASAAAEHEETTADLDRRAMRTRLLMLERVMILVIALVSTAVVLMQFELVRTVGVSLLASAGVAGVVLGFAAQRTLGGFIGGVELAFTQPLRIGDTVVVQGEFGTVEDMFFTYVVLRCWDGRRLIVPISRLLAEPFENWTRRSPEMLVTIEVRADFGVPVDVVRAEVVRAAQAHPLWDGRVAKLQVLDTSEHSVQLRALVSVADGLQGSDLKNDLREVLLAFLQQLDGGAHLPRTRVIGADVDTGNVGAQARA